MSTPPSNRSQEASSQHPTEPERYVRGKTDPAWGHCKQIVDEHGKKALLCLHCNKSYKGGGINRFKSHLAGEGGQVEKCKKVSADIRFQMKQHIEEGRKRKTPEGTQASSCPIDQDLTRDDSSSIPMAVPITTQQGNAAGRIGLETGVVTPLGDNREYKRIVIPNNNLEVLLVSDKETSKCAACMSIGVGSNDDPDELNGLAHLLEHMVFCASSKYPDEYGFPKYVKEHGGETNGTTERGYMVLSFDVYKEAFKNALDRFAQIFIGPIFSDEATIKEVNVVDKEYTEKSEDVKLELLQRHIALKGHPYNKF